MYETIVVDTNVLVHCTSCQDATLQDESIKFVELLMSSAVSICVDPGFDREASKNSSLIGAEYIRHLQPGTLGYALLIERSLSGKIHSVSKKTEPSIRRCTDQLIRNKRDRIFVRVAYNTSDRVLISHDYKDFQQAKRATIKKMLGISILAAREATI